MRQVSPCLKFTMVLSLVFFLPGPASSQSPSEPSNSNFDKKLLVDLENQLDEFHESKKFSGVVLSTSKIAFTAFSSCDEDRNGIDSMTGIFSTGFLEMEAFTRQPETW